MRPDEDEYVLHCLAVIAARKAAGLEPATADTSDAWWDEGPHVEKDGRSYYVHAMGCLQSHLGHAILEHPNWYLIAALVRGDEIELHGFDDPVITLGEVRTAGEALPADKVRVAIDLTPREKRKMWGVSR